MQKTFEQLVSEIEAILNDQTDLMEYVIHPNDYCIINEHNGIEYKRELVAFAKNTKFFLEIETLGM